MSDIAIRVENLSKRYHIGQLHQRHDTLRDERVDSVRQITNHGLHRLLGLEKRKLSAPVREIRG